MRRWQTERMRTIITTENCERIVNTNSDHERFVFKSFGLSSHRSSQTIFSSLSKQQKDTGGDAPGHSGIHCGEYIRTRARDICFVVCTAFG